MKPHLPSVLIAVAFLCAGECPALPPDPALNGDAIRDHIREARAMGDACISDEKGNLCVVTSAYLAGGISGVVWNGKEFVDDEGHGGSLQYALVVDGLGTAYNPTEAGGKPDDYHFRDFNGNRHADFALQKDYVIAPDWAKTPQETLTSSVLQKFTSTATTITSESRMAFWLTPKSTLDEWTDAKGVNHPAPAAVNTAATSNYILKKTITIAPKDFPVPVGLDIGVIKMEAEITIPPLDDEIKKALADPARNATEKQRATPTITIEAPTGYLLKDFDKYYEFIPQTPTRENPIIKDISKSHGAASPNDPYETGNPIIFATEDGKYAMGVVYSLEELYDGRAWPVYHTYVTDSAYSRGLSKWNITYNAPLGDKPSVVTHTVYLVIGTLDDVKKALTEYFTPS